MNLADVDWSALERLRAEFLAGTAGERDYWRSDHELACYDATFAQRIGWKWSYVLNELARRQWTFPAGPILDWGCGTGIASRTVLRHFDLAPTLTLSLWDRSTLAMRFAARRIAEEWEQLNIATILPATPGGGTLLISHVITELNPPQLEDLIRLAETMDAVIWIEPGTHAASHALIRARERLRGAFAVVAPCVHSDACGMLRPDQGHHWCHHFAAPPPEIFQDGAWMRFARLAGIDLRSLPLSFLVLDRRAAAAKVPGSVRVIGKPRVYKGHALLLGCGESGLRECRVSKRRLPELFRACQKEKNDPLQVWQTDANEIVAAETFPGKPA